MGKPRTEEDREGGTPFDGGLTIVPDSYTAANAIGECRKQNDQHILRLQVLHTFCLGPCYFWFNVTSNGEFFGLQTPHVSPIIILFRSYFQEVRNGYPSVDVLLARASYISTLLESITFRNVAQLRNYSTHTTTPNSRRAVYFSGESVRWRQSRELAFPN
ncbi:hypothetical protein CC78DRAFT_579181 [Lojkania enalia]|uniref:Uncharacterized protein n=1 Tax=Lojkania enalia TaxID=147567 RepID=A0A9P4KDH4_9PLEO|nr:hypothetical protein CC78DRAFT_579181 [Didymosphaeria enalia]